MADTLAWAALAGVLRAKLESAAATMRAVADTMDDADPTPEGRAHHQILREGAARAEAAAGITPDDAMARIAGGERRAAA